jgi:hypothetical protein
MPVPAKVLPNGSIRIYSKLLAPVTGQSYSKKLKSLPNILGIVFMLDNIKALPLADKKTLLAMLQADLGLTVKVDITVDKTTWYQMETRRCNEIAIVKRSGGQVIYSDLQSCE